jgi:hypothetical protein
MSNDEKGLAPAVPDTLPATIEMGANGLQLRTIEDLWRLAQGIHAARMAPKSLDTQDKIAIAILRGGEVGLAPMLSVASIAVINGVPGWITKVARALVRNSGHMKPGTRIEEGVTHADDCTMSATTRCADGCYGYCRTWRNGDDTPAEVRFSVADAKRANLWKKAGPWQEYHSRMLMHRATGFNFDDNWSDVLNGMTTIDVLQDHPQAAFIREGEAIVTDATPPGRDPLLPPASGVVVDVSEEPGEPAKGDSSEPSGSESEALGSSEPHPIITDPIEGPEDGEPEAATDPMDEPLPPRYVADEEEEKEPAPKPKKKAARKPKPKDEPKGADIQVCSVDGCGREFDTDREAHWIRGGLFRCAECGPFPK